MKGGLSLLYCRNTKGIGDYIENIYATKQENLKEMKNFLNSYNFPKLNQDVVEYLNKLVTFEEIEMVIMRFPKNKNQI